ncbi:hypothetical protein G6F29_001125 [Rhizopus arrhizus]|jgi:hypothetical protein|nr:hypothetical protein G6F30_000450 [Rhizopus arrhizus]KAG0989251.1 hypothetical protein G6F29_001125 [Rhizopus arrhizus]KAG1027630.1 hypothetical protein G6F26_003260 [Rhizopus arrhizus]KAG1042809.1 hypothetical protein G6F25_002899 [Rhizopus arrhizus]
MIKKFNIATEDIALLREDLKYWRSLAITDQSVPPMTIDIYLDTSKLSTNQTLSAVDDNLRWGCVDVLRVNRILIETWVLTLKSPSGYAVDLPNLYKRSILFFRSLHSFVRLLPTYELYRKIRKSNESNPLSIGYRLSSNPNTQYNSEIHLDSTILENDARKPTSHYEFSDIVTPMGTFNLAVTYRRNCDFKVEDRERDLSAQFIDMDEQFFTPTMTKYQEEYAKPRAATPKESSSASTKGPREINVGRPKSSSSITSSRRASAAFTVSPFKSPFLSSSPQADSLFSTTAVSRQPMTSAGSSSRQGLDSGSFGRKIEFSSSFDKYKSSPTGKIPDSPSLSSIRRLSRTSDHSFISNHEEDELKEFVKMMTPNQEHRLFQQRNSFTPLSTDTSTGSDMTSSIAGSIFTNKKAALSHFQNLRDTHTSLSESLSSSMMMAANNTNNNNQDPVSGTSPVSSTSSTGRSYQPIIPSPLHVEQRSFSTTSPVHIPRSYPQVRSMISNSNNALGIAKLDDERSCDMSAYSTYPQDGLHHQDLHILTNNKSLKQESNPPGAGGGLQTKGGSMLDDDDSLVFKMSELGCESSPIQHQQQDQQMLYNRPGNRLQARQKLEQSINLTKESKPTSPPLLERLQQSNEGSIKSPNPLPPFDAW